MLCPKNILDIFDCNVKTNYQILIIFGMNISDTTCHQMTIQIRTSPNVCFCTTWGKHNQRNIDFFYLMRYDCLINITRKTHFVHISDIFQLPAVKLLSSPLCENRQGDAFSIY